VESIREKYRMQAMVSLWRHYDTTTAALWYHYAAVVVPLWHHNHKGHEGSLRTCWLLLLLFKPAKRVTQGSPPRKRWESRYKIPEPQRLAYSRLMSKKR
jgi:hypothetical protein